MNKRVIYLTVLFFWLASGLGGPAVAMHEPVNAPDRAAGFAAQDAVATEPVAGVSAQAGVLSLSPNQDGSLNARTGSYGLSGSTSPQVQASTTTPSADHDYDGLTDAVETGGWSDAAGSFTTDPFDPDSDDDGLTDGEEKLYDTDPLDDHSPGVYVEYEDHLQTRQYSAKDSHSEQPWGWQQYADRLISLDAVVVRRGTTFSVGGPADATIEITKSIGSLTDLTPVRDPCAGRWRISLPSGGTVGEYGIHMEDGDWNGNLNLYVIFELPTPTSNLTEAMIDAFLYDDDPANMRDEYGILLNSNGYEYYHEDYPAYIPEGAWINAGSCYRFELQPFEPFVFEEHVIKAINGNTSQGSAADDLVAYADKVTRFNNPRYLLSSWRVLHPGTDDSNQCSNISGLLTAFERAAGIPARPFFVDRVHATFDHAVEMWVNGTWYAARGYYRREPEGCGWECDYGYVSRRSRYSWGRYQYPPWHSGGSGNGSIIASVDENWSYGLAYRWPSWDWDAIARYNWFETMFAPYWSSYGWSQEPHVTGGATTWPPIRDFATSASPGSRTVVRDNSTSYNVTLETSDGFSNIVDLSVLDLPSGTTAEFVPDEDCVPTCISTLVVTPTATTTLDTHTLTVQGESGGLVREDTVDMVVTDFAIDGSPGSQVVKAGESTSYTMTLQALNGFNDTVGLSVTGVPADTAAYFDDSTWESPYSNRSLYVVTTSDTPAGDYTLTIQGTVGTAVRETTVQLSVTDFTIDASPELREVEQGNSTSYTVNLEALNGFNDTVDLDVTGLPLNATAGFDPGSCEPDCSSTLSVVTASDTPTGTYTLTIYGDGHPPERQTTVDLQVTEPSGGASLGFFHLASSESTGEVADAGIPRAHYLLKPLPADQPVASSSAALDEVPDDDETGLVARGVSDYGVDLDGDGYLDQLVVEVEVESGQPGIYWIQGEIGSDHLVPELGWTGGIIAAATVRAELVEGTNTVQLAFEGLRISAAKVDGPYVLKYLSITDVDNPGSEHFANNPLGHWISLYTTAAYQAYGFENWGALLSGHITERGLDADGDTLYESLALDVGLDVFEPGTYTVQGDLYDGQDSFIGRATWTGTSSMASLQFDGLPGTEGPYTLKNAYLLNADGEIIDSMAEAYTTQQEIIAQGRTHIVQPASSGDLGLQGIVPGTYSDRGVDLDEDGLYDLLEIDVQVEAEEAGLYQLEGWLEDADGRLISWAGSEPVNLIIGTHSISLTFSGPAIHAHNADGPFTLVALKLLKGDGYDVLDQVDVAYTTTSSYTRDDFESLPYLSLSATFILLFEDYMEAGEGGWTSDDPWAIATGESHSPICAWTDSPGGNYANNVDVSLATTVPTIQFTFGRPALQFQTCYNLETDFDYGYVEVSPNDGVTWTRVATYTGSTVHWSGETVDLGEVSDTEALQVRFRLNTDPGTTADGWYVDNVAVFFDTDLDHDGIPNDVEVGDDPSDPVDTDDDGIPDYMDDDSDDDDIPDDVEAGDDPANPVDTDDDGIPDYRDDDSDDDDVPDDVEAGDDPANPVDTDDDGTPDYQDVDADDDTILDAEEYDVDQATSTTGDLCRNLGVDDDNDGIPDCQDNDADGDGVPNYRDLDSDGDTLLDSVEAGDTNLNTAPVDSDGDGLPNFLDLDSDDDDIPDESDPEPFGVTRYLYLPVVYE